LQVAAALPPFLAACCGLPTTHTPIWIMRQAGRYLPEYRALRARHDFEAVMRTPELAAEATLQPIRRFPLDAAILFSDIMTPLDGFGLGLRFAPGPVLERPVRSAAAVEALPTLDIEKSASYVMAAIRTLRRELPANVPLIGFAGAPFTLFCYLVQGRGGGDFAVAKQFLLAEPRAAELLLDKLADLSLDYLTAQAHAGAQALMLFDSWGGLLERVQFRDLIVPRLRRIVDGLSGLGLPRIYFPRSTSASADGSSMLAEVAGLSIEVVGVDWHTSLSQARSILGPGVALQGNLEPAALFAEDGELDRRADQVLAEAGSGPGHIFNLGHGIEPTTDPQKLARLIDHVHRRTARQAVAP
jgi:uroporphyrinogen decarboxylase